MAQESALTTVAATQNWRTSDAWRRLFRERPVVPLLVLLAALVLIYGVSRPGVIDANWAGVIFRAAVPLAILAGCQTLAMLTGGIDLSVGAVASMAGFMVASLLSTHGLAVGIAVGLGAALLAGLLNGIGIGIFRVHPLIMTLGVGLVVLGLDNAWQIASVTSAARVPTEFRFIGSERVGQILPYSLVVFIPIALAILIGLRRTGYGRMLFAIGDNPIAARLSGVTVLASPGRAVRHLGTLRRAGRVSADRPQQRGERDPGRPVSCCRRWPLR